MIGLEKTKAAAGEVSQSACALTLEDMHKLYVLCLETLGLSFGEYCWGVVRYMSSFTLNTISEYSVQHLKMIFLLAWLLLLRIEEAIWSLRALTFIQERVCSISHSVAL